MHFNKRDFSFFKNNKIIYFDNSGTSIKPKQVINEVINYYKNYSTNPHNADSKIGYDLVNKIVNIRGIVKTFINANNCKEIVFIPSTTFGINQIAYGIQEIIKPNDEIVLTKLEHASNFLPWCNLAKNKKAKIKFLNIKNNLIDIDLINKAVTSKTKIVSFAPNSNIFGYDNDSKKIIKEIRKINPNIIIIIDAAQSILQTKIDVQELDVDFLTFSAHKMFGPTGIGVLYGKLDKLEKLKPMLLGGGMSGTIINKNDNYEISYNDLPERLEGGTPNVAGIFGLGKAIQYINDNLGGTLKIHNYLIELRRYLIHKLKSKLQDRIIIYNDQYDSSILLFNIKNVFSQDVASFLGTEKNIILRAGEHCNKLFDNIIKEKTALRISLGIYNTKKEIDKLVNILENETDFLGSLV